VRGPEAVGAVHDPGACVVDVVVTEGTGAVGALSAAGESVGCVPGCVLGPGGAAVPPASTAAIRMIPATPAPAITTGPTLLGPVVGAPTDAAAGARSFLGDSPGSDT
jgi:hypothetical protein